MQASNGFYSDKLDHLRALAVFLVFFWHFVHGSAAHPLVPFDYVPPLALFPLSLLEQGQSGVALFMVLSGYLFSRLIGDETLVISSFVLNRALRLLPALALVVIPHVIKGEETVVSLLAGFLFGWTADGTWSVAVEIQFYCLLPILLWLGRGRMLTVLSAALILAVLLRCAIHLRGANLRDLVAFSLVGHADNFILGMALAIVERRFGTAGKPRLAGAVFLAFLAYSHAMNWAGGFAISPASAFWIVHPIIESIGFAALIHAYCTAGFELPRWCRRSVARVGEYSYSIYLFHFAIVIVAAPLVAMAVPSRHVWAVGLMSLPVFLVCVVIGGLSYTWIEKPFPRLRRPYLRPAPRKNEAASPVLV